MSRFYTCRLLTSFFIVYISISISIYDKMACAQNSTHRSISGIYPHLAYWNPHAECGTGAVVPWAGKLWVITYAPHFPQGSEDKLYYITPDLEKTTFEDSVGGTPANRMIHRETNQLIIGPYIIDGEGNIRVIPPSKMFGRLTGNARHLFEPERKVYYATMEEGIYEVDLATLEVTELFRDYQVDPESNDPNKYQSDGPLANVPGYHGKGLYSGQGRLIYANNGERSSEARRNPNVPSGCLAEWDGKSKEWKVIRRNQFTDVRGPGGLYGNPNPKTDPIWAIGWDHRSLLLMLLDDGEWYTYRLPKASHTYDGAHGWNTEWPRFRDIGEEDMVMNMHGMFWRFPKTFSYKNSAGIKPRSTYLKVIGDYCRWGEKLVFGCDDTAKSEFLNKRKAKGNLAAPGQSHSNLWFTKPSILDELGPPLGRGAVWTNDDVEANTPSDPYLFGGFDRRSVHIEHNSSKPVTFMFEVDKKGNGKWQEFHNITVAANSSTWHPFEPNENGVWLRVSTDRDSKGTTVQFVYSNADQRKTKADPIFDGLTGPHSQNYSAGLVRVRGAELKKLAYVAYQVRNGKKSDPHFYELDGELNLKRSEDTTALQWTLDNTQVPIDVLSVDDASIIYVDDNGNRWRLPKGSSALDQEGVLGPERIDREVVTERDLFNCGGIFYELPAQNAGGFAKIRPICTHNLRIKDYCSYRGLLILTGVDADAPRDNEHIIRSDDGKVALWAGVVDDLWKMGKPVGTGGPWHKSDIKAGEPSDPYLITGFDNKSVTLSNHSNESVTITLQVEIDGSGIWVDYRSFKVPANDSQTSQFPESFSAYWVRAVSDKNTNASVMFTYGQ